MAPSRPETKFFFVSPRAGGGHRCHHFSKLEKASLKFIFLGPGGPKIGWGWMDGLERMRLYSTMRLLSVSWPCIASLYQRHNSIWGMV